MLLYCASLELSRPRGDPKSFVQGQIRRFSVHLLLHNSFPYLRHFNSSHDFQNPSLSLSPLVLSTISFLSLLSLTFFLLFRCVYIYIQYLFNFPDREIKLIVSRRLQVTAMAVYGEKKHWWLRNKKVCVLLLLQFSDKSQTNLMDTVFVQCFLSFLTRSLTNT